MSSIENKTASIALVHPSQVIRQVIKNYLQSIGYTNTLLFPDYKSCLSQMEAQRFDLIFGGLAMSEEINALQVLDAIANYRELRQVRMVMFSDASETNYLLPAFERGLLDCVRDLGTNKDEIDRALERLFTKWSALNFDELEVSKQSIVPLLQGSSDRLVKYLENFIECRSGDAKSMMELALELRSLERSDEAEPLAMQAIALDTGLKELWGEVKESAVAERFNVLQLLNVGILGAEASEAESLKVIFEELGVANLFVFTSAEQALDVFSSKDFDLLLIGWKIPEISGNTFLQKLLNRIAAVPPILVMSESLSEEDLVILQELGVFGLVTKPVKRQDLVLKVTLTVRESRKASDPRLAIQNIRRLIVRCQQVSAVGEIEKLKLLNSIDEGTILELQGQLKFSERLYEESKALCLEALSKGETTIFTLSLLAKSLMKLREFDAAIRCLEVADTMAPGNISRLCLIADSHIEKGDMAAADGVIESASSLDPGSEDVAASKLKKEILTGGIDNAKDLMSKMQSPNSIISFMNSRAVALALSGKYIECLKVYDQTSAAISPERTDLLAIVSYNKALSYARAKDLTSCLLALEAAENGADANLMKRVISLKVRVKKAIDTNTELLLNEASRVVSLPQDEIKNRMDQYKLNLSINPGDLCSFRILDLDTENSLLLGKLEKVSFRARSVINRDEMATT
jgi:DNA-binding response OmpR family regulator